MTRFDQSYFDTVTETVELAETKTSAELVVAVFPQSGGYRDVDYLWGGILALIWLLFVVFNPWFVHPDFAIPLETALFFGIGSVISSALPWLRRCLTTTARRDDQVRAAASCMFVTDGVANTRARTGVLIYLSRLEQQLEVIADIGIVENVKTDVWNECVFELKHVAAANDPAEALLNGIRRMEDLLAEYLPAGDDNPDEIPNRARVQQ